MRICIPSMGMYLQGIAGHFDETPQFTIFEGSFSGIVFGCTERQKSKEWCKVVSKEIIALVL